MLAMHASPSEKLEGQQKMTQIPASWALKNSSARGAKKSTARRTFFYRGIAEIRGLGELSAPD
jgi:hypothetical protein